MAKSAAAKAISVIADSIKKPQKTFDDVVGPTTPVAGRGQKLCPNCAKVIGARAKQCQHCGHVFEETVAKAVTVRVRKSKSSETADMHSVYTLRFILGSGGPAKAIEAIHAIPNDAAIGFAIACGGVPEALRQIEEELLRSGIAD